MREYVINRPAPDAMGRILDQAGPEGIVLRLAWQAGLSRDEISALTWDQVSFLDSRLELPARMVPLEVDLRSALWRLYEANHEVSPRVVLSSRGKTPMAPESISRLARLALDREGQTHVRLMDLRHDWILRQLMDKDWAEVARISGVEVPALQARFSSHVPEKKNAPRSSAQVDEFKLWRVLQAERGTPAGLALWLTWQLGLQAQEIISLTWDQVDFSKDALRFEDRELPLTNAVRRILEDTRRKRRSGDPPQVLLTERSRKPLDLPRLSRMTRAALIRGGMEHTLLRDLRRDENREDEDARLLEAAQRGPLSRGDVMALLGLSKTAAYGRLHRLTEQKRLVRIGGKYYPPESVVPPDRHWETIRTYLTQAGFAYRQDIAQLLRIRPKQCTLLLRHLVEDGELIQTGQKYFLPEKRGKKAE
ncbi:hypothetical protein [Pusillibacter faecalis]|uniref:hypothetical protein n=1 Tax=Pusillibacter faecalis TaxID=2714358 RepID=UPI0029433D71|nr:hypothetical protein [Pusillibacter faecalis]